MLLIHYHMEGGVKVRVRQNLEHLHEQANKLVSYNVCIQNTLYFKISHMGGTGFGQQ